MNLILSLHLVPFHFCFCSVFSCSMFQSFLFDTMVCFLPFFLFFIPFDSFFSLVFYVVRVSLIVVNVLSLSHRGKPIGHCSAEAQRLACSVCCCCTEAVVINPGSQRTGWNKFFNPGSGGLGSLSSRKLFTSFFRQKRALRLLNSGCLIPVTSNCGVR